MKIDCSKLIDFKFENELSETAYGEPQIWISFESSRSIEITHEEYGLDKEEQFYSIRYHCNEDEFSNFENTIGVIGIGMVNSLIEISDSLNAIIKFYNEKLTKEEITFYKECEIKLKERTMSQNLKQIYLAHPISLLSADEVFNYYDNMAKELNDYYTILSPMQGKDSLRTEKEFRSEGYTENPLTANHAIFERDTWMVNQSDVILCDLRGTKNVSIGCCMEMAIGSWLHKYIIVVMEDDNIHNHAFVREASSVIFNDMDNALSYLKSFSNSMNKA